ncbi:MAG: hypothetical protein AB7S93_10930 [Xanthobacteraceae bacterium]
MATGTARGRIATGRLRYPQALPSLHRGAAFARGVPDCPNAVQPELSIVSKLLIGPVRGDGKGADRHWACHAVTKDGAKGLKRLKNFFSAAH